MPVGKQAKLEWLDEHLLYELRMLRYTYEQLTVPTFQVDWNSYFESFAVHVRNIAAFLTNDGGANNFKASDFVKGFKARKGNAQGALNDLEQQVFHLGKKRPIAPEDKVHTGRAKIAYNWAEKWISDFLRKALLEYPLDLSRGELPRDFIPTITIDTNAACATNSIMIVTSRHSYLHDTTSRKRSVATARVPKPSSRLVVPSSTMTHGCGAKVSPFEPPSLAAWPVGADPLARGAGKRSPHMTDQRRQRPARLLASRVVPPCFSALRLPRRAPEPVARRACGSASCPSALHGRSLRRARRTAVRSSR